ncbi:hypothetical protein L3Y34_003532 [Caenorhabditis briggsae]|uniref:Uncharacterized protein n=1 Tax=Caenorhabditis briggsae TaxID=6238 RepID=A0AAE9ADH7_CAEBR|nr:hypothetical protein L3Y34_003532 [Caenorhabditis briggsae]
MHLCNGLEYSENLFHSHKKRLKHADEDGARPPIDLTSSPKTFKWNEMFPYGFICGHSRQVYKLETRSGSREEIVMMMYNHISELFQKCPSLRFGARISAPNMSYYIPIPSLSIATFKDVSANDLTTFMSNHLDLKLLVLEKEHLREIPDIINFRNLRVMCFQESFLHYMSHFKGVNAYFCGPTEEYYIREFIYRWLNGKLYENLNLIHIEQEDGERFSPDLLENYRHNRWDLNRMPQEYKLDEGDKYYTQFPGPFKMENAVYVQRESDGKVLSLQNTPRIFIGCVWNQEDVFRE